MPNNVKSLCGGMVRRPSPSIQPKPQNSNIDQINTAFQIGSGVGLALTSAIVTAIDTNKGHGIITQYRTGLWCCVGFAGIGVFSSFFGVKGTSRFTGEIHMVH